MSYDSTDDTLTHIETVQKFLGEVIADQSETTFVICAAEDPDSPGVHCGRDRGHEGLCGWAYRRTTKTDRSKLTVGIWLCCVVYAYADGSNSTGRKDGGGCPNCGGHGRYRSVEK